MSIELIYGFLQEQIEARWQSSGNILFSNFSQQRCVATYIASRVSVGAIESTIFHVEDNNIILFGRMVVKPITD